jgi:hypothetical protein
MEKTAQAVRDAVVVASVTELDGQSYLSVDIRPEAESYPDWKRLPEVLSMNGRLYAKTGYNSDTGRAYYATGRLIARRA